MNSKRRAAALFSGGLDSMLAVRILQEQDIDVVAVNFRTQFTCCQDLAGRGALELGIPLTVLPTDEDYVEVIKSPKHGYGKGANPCVDCRVYMFQKAMAHLKDLDADFVVSGEVVGQRPMSQKKRDLKLISEKSDPEELLLRPLSAKLLPETLPEREGWVDRERLYGFAGRGRKPLIALAKQLGIERIPQPSTGCALTEPLFSRKVFDLIKRDETAASWDFELLRVGRHVRMDATTKVIVGRREAENLRLAGLFDEAGREDVMLVRPDGFAGPTALVVGATGEGAVEFAGGLILRYAVGADDDAEAEREYVAELRTADGASQVRLRTHEAAATARTL